MYAKISKNNNSFFPALPTPEDGSLFQNRVDPRIVGGSVAAPGSHPHMAALATGLLIRSFLCGGSIISQRTVLTAAHCIIRLIGSNGSLGRYSKYFMETKIFRFKILGGFK